MGQKPLSQLPCGHHRILPFPDIVTGVPVPGEGVDQMGSKEPLPLKAARPPLGFHIAFPGWWRWEWWGESGSRAVGQS